MRAASLVEPRKPFGRVDGIPELDRHSVGRHQAAAISIASASPNWCQRTLPGLRSVAVTTAPQTRFSNRNSSLWSAA